MQAVEVSQEEPKGDYFWWGTDRKQNHKYITGNREFLTMSKGRDKVGKK